MGFEKEILIPLRRNVDKFADYPAFCIQDVTYTYKEFGERISAIRNVIRNASDDEQIWGLALYDNLNTYASVFALWMEGKSYVPLHPSWPKDRIEDIKKQVGCSNVLDDCDMPYTSDMLDDWNYVDEDGLAYILFTSGSTGVPKGVQLSRKNIASFMDSFWKTGISINETDRCMQVFDMTFDVSIQSFLVALTRGACVYTVPYGQVKYLYAASLIQNKKVTFGAMAPSMLTYLKPYFGELDASSMKVTILTAEACPIDLMEAWFKCARNTEIFDFYGPTEATIYCTYYKLSRKDDNLSANGIVSIGKPMANVNAVIIDDRGTIITNNQNTKGELCVAGNQITQGYWNNADKNKASFSTIDGMRYYHTGDLCYWDESGNILYSGRIDQQAKIQGFRVELGEIEYHARTFYANRYRVIAVAFQNANDLTEIALFVEVKEENAKLLAEYLRTKMPAYMIPTRILFEESFPLNRSEKIDRNALKEKLR